MGPGAISLLLTLLVAPAQESSIESLVRLLHSDDLAERERASAGLLKLGSKALPALGEVAKGVDAEASARAKALIQGIQIRRLSRPIVARVDSPFTRFGRADHLQVTPDGKLAMGCDLENFYVWTAAEGGLIKTWRGHVRSIDAAILSPDGARLLSRGHFNLELSLWDFPSGRLLGTFQSDRRSPRQVVVAPGGERLALANGDVEWVEAATGRVLWNWTDSRGAGGAFTVDVSRDGRHLAIGTHNSPWLTLLEVDGQRDRKLDLRSNSLGFGSRVHFTDDGLGVVVDHHLAGARHYDLSSGVMKAKVDAAARYTVRGRQTKFEVIRPGGRKEGGHLFLELEKPDTVMESVLTPDDGYVLVRTLNGRSITCFDLKDSNRRTQIGQEAACFAFGSLGVLVGTRTGDVALYDLKGKELRRVRHGAGAVSLVAFAGASRVVSQGSDLVFRCVDLETGRELWRREFVPFKRGPMRFHPDRRRAFATFEGPNHTSDLALWDLENGVILRRYGGGVSSLRGSAVSPDGSLVAVSGHKGFLAVWEVESGKKLWGTATGRMIGCLDFTADGKSLVLCGEDGGIERKSAASGTLEKTFSDKGPRVLSSSVSVDGLLLATCGDQGPLSIFEIESGRKIHEVIGVGWPPAFVGNRTVLTPFASISVNTGDVTRHRPRIAAHASAIDGSRTRLAIADTYQKRVAVAQAEGGGLLWDIDLPFMPTHVALGPRGDRAVLCQNEGEGRIEGFAVGSKEPDWTAKEWMSAADSSNGHLFVLKNDGMNVFDMKSHELVRVMKGTLDGQFVIPPDSRFAFSRRNGRTLLVDLSTLGEIRELPDLQEIKHLDIDPSGRFLLDRMRILDAQTGAEIGKIEVDLPGMSRESKEVRTFFGPDGLKIYAVTMLGLVITLVPGE